MSYLTDNNNMYLDEVLSFPLVHRCAELGLLIDRCGIKELQDFFPLLVQSIFGIFPGDCQLPPQLGWGLRTITRMDPQEFDVLYSFFIPMGPMFRFCYRLLNEPIKFEVPLDMLPSNTSEMLFTGRYAQFYADLIHVDPSVRQISALSLNAFDYFLLHFALHGMQPLHRCHPAAMAVHNEKIDTIYVFMCADFFCSFLPSHPDAVVMPSNICGTVKMASVMTTIQPIQPNYSPKYLKLSALNHTFNTTSASNVSHGSNAGSPAIKNNSACAGSGSPTGLSVGQIRSAPTSATSDQPLRSYTWRTESTMYLFIDTWLRYDIDANFELPSSEFIRCVRILIKQLHHFANSADLDLTPMLPLRQLAQPMLNAQTYSFLRALIKRWPLDSSFSVVLELWLTYIQPWRYSLERLQHESNRGGVINQAPIDQQYPQQQPNIHRRFEYFVKENMVAYTQIFVQLLPRIERLDFSSLKNVLMMHRLLKVFGQANLAEMLRGNEFDVYAAKSYMSSSSPKDLPKTAAAHHHHRSVMSDWSSYRADSLLHDDDEGSYVCMFGPEVQQQIRHICEKMLITRQVELDRAAYLQTELHKRCYGLRGYLKWFLVNEEDVAQEQALNDCRKIPAILDRMLQQTAMIFEIDLSEVDAFLDRSGVFQDTTANQSHDMDVTFTDYSTSRSGIMSTSMQAAQYTVDPAQVPAKSNEMTFLVRFLYQLSSKLNLMYREQISAFWHRNDLAGRLARQILHPPMVVHSFDKSQGVSVVCEHQLTPRVDLRFLASYQTCAVIVGSFVVGQIIYGVPSFGFLTLLLVTMFYLLVLSLVHDPK